MTKLTHGCIPANTECPYQAECIDKRFCNHTGTAHPAPFSCVTARGWEMTKRPAPVLKTYKPNIAA